MSSDLLNRRSRTSRTGTWPSSWSTLCCKMHTKLLVICSILPGTHTILLPMFTILLVSYTLPLVTYTILLVTCLNRSRTSPTGAGPRSWSTPCSNVSSKLESACFVCSDISSKLWHQVSSLDLQWFASMSSDFHQPQVTCLNVKSLASISNEFYPPNYPEWFW